jgi:hypothetical protein
MRANPAAALALLGAFGAIMPAHAQAGTAARIGWEDACNDVDRDGGCRFTVVVTGSIDHEILSRFEKALQHWSSDQRLEVVLDSPGGDVYAAMELGRLIRRNHGHTVVKRGSCASACALIFAAGVVRSIVDGRVGIHRPVLATIVTDEGTVKRAADEITRALSIYANDMNISGRFIEDMLVIPPEKIRWLSQRDLDGYGISLADPVFAETVVMANAQRYGVSPAEYRRRAQLVGQICPLTNDEALGYPDAERSACSKCVLRTGDGPGELTFCDLIPEEH